MMDMTSHFSRFWLVSLWGIWLTCFFWNPVFAWSYGTGVNVYFTPNQRVDKVILAEVARAEKSVYLASYSCSWRRLADCLKALKVQKKADVKIFLENPPPAGLRAGLLHNIRLDPGNNLFHAKFIVIDQETVLLGSLNFTEDNLYLNHNNLLVVRDKDLAGFLGRKFLAWWNREKSAETYEKGPWAVLFSPENDCEAGIKEVLGQARSSIHLLNFDFTSEVLAEVIVRRRTAGVKVYGLMEKTKVLPYSVFFFLKDLGCEMRRSNMAGLLHDKTFIIDEEIVITGSYNPTRSARKNTECLLIVKDQELAGRMLKEWKSLWLWKSIP